MKIQHFLLPQQADSAVKTGAGLHNQIILPEKSILCFTCHDLQTSPFKEKKGL